MKKIIVFLSFVAMCFCVETQAQTYQVKPVALTTTSYGNALDTVTNTASKVTTPFRVSNWHLGVTAQVVVTKISGTVGGSIGLYGSMDGTNFTLIGSATTPSDASANYSFNTTAAWYYYQLKYTGTGTMSASIKPFIMAY